MSDYVAWCDRIYGLAPEQRAGPPGYCLLGEETFYGWRDKVGSIGDLLQFAKLRPVSEAPQGKFVF